jgi:hypothetical protein
MIENREDVALLVEGEAQSVVRLHRDPPAEYDNTAWSVVDRDGQKVLLECAVIQCPDCEERAYWTRGTVACRHCQTRQRLIG